jgi:hypothetical protein
MYHLAIDRCYSTVATVCSSAPVYYIPDFMLAISPTIQEYVNLTHRSKTDIAAVILESAIEAPVC